ncbi:AraC family transcriptional regulator [Paenibacillus hodogayensis]|uniref:AraC family transcriptional regulator n=1 Tax=Paenibacillus hodogayensis TaxID=279208 RepID=A0ABV5W750_9BACL
MSASFFENYMLPEPYHLVHMLSRDKGYQLAEHHHPMFQIIWVTKGVLHVEHDGIEHRLRRGQICIIPPGHPHALLSESGYQQIGIDLSEMPDQRGIISLMKKQVEQFVVVDLSDMLSTISELQEHSSQLTLLARLQTAGILDSVLLNCLRMLDSQTSLRSQMLVLMNMHLSEALSIDELANRLSVSPSTVKRIANREFGCSVMGLYNQLKINKARFLLLHSDMSIKQIAEALGFFDHSHFFRFFKQKMNVTPAQFKKANIL